MPDPCSNDLVQWWNAWSNPALWQNDGAVTNYWQEGTYVPPSTYGADPAALPLPMWQAPVTTSAVAAWSHPGRMVLSPKKQRETVTVQMDFAGYVDPSDSIVKVGSFQDLLSGTSYGGTPLTIETPRLNGTIVSYMIAGGVIGNTYRLSYFAALSSQQIIQLTGYLTIIPDSPAMTALDVAVGGSGGTGTGGGSTGGGTGTGGGGGGAPPPVVTPAPTVTLGANPTSIANGGTSTLTWSTTNATSTMASGGWTGSKALSGSASSGPLTATTTFTLSATGPGGTSSQSAVVTVAPAPPAASGQIQVTTAYVNFSQYGYFGYTTPQGSISPNHLPQGGATALGLTIQYLYSGGTNASLPAPNTYELVLTVAYDARATQTNQFDTITMVDDLGNTRTYSSASVGSFSSISANGTTWTWYGSSDAMGTSGKTYTFSVVKA